MEEQRMDGRFRLTRLVRTNSSEIYLIWEEENRVGQLDLHFAHDTIHATLILESGLSVTSELELRRMRGVVAGRTADRAAYEDIFWALLNSTEFSFNH